MRIKSNKLNTDCLFHGVNQWDETLTRMMCTRYFAFINAKYNWVIKSFTEQDIKDCAEEDYNNWTFDYRDWWTLQSGAESVQEWLQVNKWVTCDLIVTTNDIEVYDYLDRGYAVWLWIAVNSLFYSDKKDWKLDLVDYVWYKWNIGHATNIIKWTCRGAFDCTDNGNESILDSYFGKSATYKCNIKEILQDIDMNTKYIFIK